MFVSCLPQRLCSAMLSAISLLVIAANFPATADPISDAMALFGKGDTAGGVMALELASAGGDVAAKARLAEYLRGLPVPYKDVARGCALAQEAAAAGNAWGKITRAECLISGDEKSPQPFELARSLARDAQNSGEVAGAYELYKIFLADPKYSYMVAGKPDIAKYNALASQALTMRSDQVEALNGLNAAAAKGYVPSAQQLIPYLADAAAPGNLDKILYVADLMRKSGVPTPPMVRSLATQAEQLKKIGNTNTSVTAFRNTYGTALLSATLQIQRQLPSDANCKPDTIKLANITAEPITGAEYLPLKLIMSNSYLIKGNWDEIWTFAGCDRTVALKLDFSADGWGGVKYNAQLAQGK